MNRIDVRAALQSSAPSTGKMPVPRGSVHHKGCKRSLARTFTTCGSACRAGFIPPRSAVAESIGGMNPALRAGRLVFGGSVPVARASSPCGRLGTKARFDIADSLQHHAPNTGKMPVPGGSLSCLPPTCSEDGLGWKPRRRMRGGFTLVEVLAATLLIAIVLPSIMEGVAVATRSATAARHRNEATSLAQGKLSELVATGEWQSGSLSGDFSPDWPQYQWQATVQPWAADTTGAGLQQLDLRVSWLDRNRQESIALSTVIYPNQTSTTATQ